MAAEVSGDDDQRPYFFLSYARSRFRPENGKDPDLWVTKLFDDLCQDIGVVTGAPKPGFMDRQIPVGRRWPDHLADALASCRVFLALLSPAYFTSEDCGKEWAAFLERAGGRQAGRDRPSAIIPVLWTRMRPDDLPVGVRSMQYLPADFPQQYTAEGFYGIMKLSRYREQYKHAVLKLARLVRDTADQTRLPVGPISDYEELDSAFADFRAGVRTRRPFRLTVAAHRLSDLPSGRDVYYYGRTVREWTPYRAPKETVPIASYAEELIRNLGHEPVVDCLDETFPEPPTSPAVLVVDPWVSRHPRISAKLRRIDDDPVHVLVPINADDRETIAAADHLSRSVGEVLGQGLGLPGSAWAVPSLHAFRAAFPKAVAEATNRHFKKAPVHPPEISPSMSRPTLELPDD